MATTRINPIQATVAGATLGTGGNLPAADVANGNNFVPYPGRIVLLQNTTGTPQTATFVTPATRQGLAVADDPVSVPATSLVVVSIADPTDFVSSAGQVDVTFSGAVNIAVLQA